MGRERGEQTSLDLFSAAADGDASPPPSPAAPKATAEPDPQRHVLPKNLRKAVKHLNDEELDLLQAATLEEMKRRGRAPSGTAVDATQSPAPLGPQDKTAARKISQRRRVEIVEVSLTRGQVNAIRSAFKAVITPARFVRQFVISDSYVRKALASDEPMR